jgi:CelD/BcsL family acetyltransferase involved in cellulose biosynthesis
MQIEVVSTNAQLDRLAPEWNELIADSESDNPFLQWEWCSTWWRHYGAGHEPAIILVRDSGRLVGLAPLYVERGVQARHPGLMQFIGTGEVCSEYLGFVLRRGQELDAGRDLIHFLLRDCRIHWRQLRLTHVPTNSPTAALLQAGLHDQQRLFRIDRAATSWNIELAPTWDEFLEFVGSKRRGRFRRALRELEKHQFEFHEVTSESELDSAWEDLKRLHQARWRRQGMPGCFASSRFAGFHRELLRPLWRRGGLLLSLLRRSGQAVAASYCLRHRGRVYFYQGGIDPEAIQFRPGHCLRVCELRRAIERGDRVFDFLSGDEDYKAQWATDQIEMIQCTVAGPGLLPRVRFGFESATKWAKESARSHLPVQTWSKLRRWKQRLTEKIPSAAQESPAEPAHVNRPL